VKKYGCSFTGDNSDIGDTTEVEFKFISDVNGERDAVSISLSNRDPAQKKRKAMWCRGCCAEANEDSLFRYNLHHISNGKKHYGSILMNNKKSCFNQKKLTFRNGKRATPLSCTSCSSTHASTGMYCDCSEVDFTSSMKNAFNNVKEAFASTNAKPCTALKIPAPKVGTLGTCKGKTSLLHGQSCTPTCGRGEVPSGQFECNNGVLECTGGCKTTSLQIKCEPPSTVVKFNVNGTTSAVIITEIVVDLEKSFEGSEALHEVLTKIIKEKQFLQYIQDMRYGGDDFLMRVPEMGQDNFLLLFTSFILNKVDFRMTFSTKAGSCVIPKEDRARNDRLEIIAVEQTMYECNEYMGTQPRKM